jgi:hypothetical protein
MSISAAMGRLQAGLSLRRATGGRFARIGPLIFAHLCDLLSDGKSYLVDRQCACIYNHLQEYPFEIKAFPMQSGPDPSATHKFPINNGDFQNDSC